MLGGSGQISISTLFWRSKLLKAEKLKRTGKKRFLPFLAKVLVTAGSYFAQDHITLGSTCLFYIHFCRRFLEKNKVRQLIMLTTTTSRSYAAGEKEWVFHLTILRRFASNILLSSECIFVCTVYWSMFLTSAAEPCLVFFLVEKEPQLMHVPYVRCLHILTDFRSLFIGPSFTCFNIGNECCYVGFVVLCFNLSSGNLIMGFPIIFPIPQLHGEDNTVLVLPTLDANHLHYPVWNAQAQRLVQGLMKSSNLICSCSCSCSFG